ncbi:hypothetical protein [Lactobacillus iners]|uniref:hypothetical protein n=1 Tax=Lactobacillus iners TaxID=147802 RepID=UPI001F492FBF|nr:hypothetical protein [Lactobacillus iners]
MNNVFEISNITKSFKNKQILKGVDLIVNRGDIIGLLGLNGEGKFHFNKNNFRYTFSRLWGG